MCISYCQAPTFLARWKSENCYANQRFHCSLGNVLVLMCSSCEQNPSNQQVKRRKVLGDGRPTRSRTSCEHEAIGWNAVTHQLLEGVQKRRRVERPNIYFIYILIYILVAQCRVTVTGVLLQLHIAPVQFSPRKRKKTSHRMFRNMHGVLNEVYL